MKPFGIFLSGCGYKNGTDIWEAVLLNYFLEGRKIKAISFSSQPYNPDRSDNSEKSSQTVPSNFFYEMALISRDKLKELKEISSETFSALIFLGGQGLLKNFTRSDEKNLFLKTEPELKRLIREIYRRKKPMAGCGVASLVIASCLRDIITSPLTLTLGNDSELSSQLEKMGVNHIITRAEEAVIDSENRIVTTSGSQMKANLSELGMGLKNLIDGILELTNKTQ
jgi:enhancing lycopene biosynthesis protein 2